MIKDIMSRSFTSFSSQDKLKKLFDVLKGDTSVEYITVQFPEHNFCTMKVAVAREVVKSLAEKMGPQVLELTLSSIPSIQNTCSAVDINESEMVAMSKAIQCSNKEIVVLDNLQPVGVVKAQVRTAIFSSVPGSLFGERYDIFEKGAVEPKYQLHCPVCEADFDFYEVIKSNDKIIYRCPKCKQAVEDL